MSSTSESEFSYSSVSNTKDHTNLVSNRRDVLPFKKVPQQIIFFQTDQGVYGFTTDSSSEREPHPGPIRPPFGLTRAQPTTSRQDDELLDVKGVHMKVYEERNKFGAALQLANAKGDIFDEERLQAEKAILSAGK
ncbi:hypothetical protein Zmor_002285 [Zophobas morio]|uniref:Uncharacterized protein n=1 Tax=Zophobas morio TaxID=2755281 RepID=A0AA38J4I7_9CUCU|nr:hypothetical protein Zmor_002285 [Zophobas morio]